MTIVKWNDCKERLWHLLDQESRLAGKVDAKIIGQIVRSHGFQNFTDTIDIWLEKSQYLQPSQANAITPGDMLRVGHQYTGVVTRVDPERSTLRLVTEPMSLPPSPGQKVQLNRNNLLFLWERKREALEDFLSEDTATVGHLQSILTGDLDDLEPLDTPDRPADFDRHQLDENQEEAVLAMIHSPDFWVVWGPPGTGKTHSIAVALHYLIERGKRVFITSHQHVAIDAVLTKLVELFPSHQDDLIRIGHSGKIHPTIQPRLLQNLMPAESFDEDDWEEVLEKIPVVAATLSACTNAILWDMKFDVVIEDEAGRPSIPTSLVGLVKAKERFVLVGDPLQLQPIVPKKAEEWARQSLLEIAMGRPEIQRYRQSDLAVQRRSHPDIVSHSSDVYREKGHPGLYIPDDFSAVLDDLPASPKEPLIDRNTPLVYINKPFSGSKWYKFGPQYSLVEPTEAAMAHEITHQLALELGYENLWLLSPFRLQSMLMASLFRKEHRDGLAMTIDQTQGGERDAVVLSLTADKKSTLANKMDFHRLNVAMTRARGKLIIIGNLLAMMEVPELEGFCTWLLEKGVEVEYDPKPATVDKAEGKLESLLQARKKFGKKLGTSLPYSSVLSELTQIPKGDRQFISEVRKIKNRGR